MQIELPPLVFNTSGYTSSMRRQHKCNVCQGCMSMPMPGMTAAAALQVSNGNMMRELQDAGSSRDVQATAWSPQGNTLVSCDKAGMLRFWPTTS